LLFHMRQAQVFIEVGEKFSRAIGTGMDEIHACSNCP
jgi:hypothetical protein